MENNLFDAIAMAASVMLFLFAAGTAIYSYERLNDQTEHFVSMSSASGRREDATSIYLDSDDIKREVPFEEVYFAILNLPKYISNEGNFTGSKIVLSVNDTRHVYTATYNKEEDKRNIHLKSDSYGKSDYEIDNPDENAVQEVLLDLVTLVTGTNPENVDTNAVLNSYQGQLGALSFGIEFGKEKIDANGNEEQYIIYSLN